MRLEDDQQAAGCARMVASVAAILSGLCAKSSITVTPPASPTISSLRLKPSKRARAPTASSTRTPSARAAAIAASAFDALWRPGT